MHNFLNNLAKYISFFKSSYGQDGEDRIIEKYLKKKKKGFYIDVGAHHPFRFSNTYLFYKKGWRGINIDATPGSMKLFKIFRPRDINIEVPISNNTKAINYFIFDEPALNGFSSKLSEQRDKNTKYKIKRVVKMKPKKLSNILDTYLPQDIKIDFMSVDVEGFEYQVLSSNNWKKYRPLYLLIEILDNSINDSTTEKIYKLLKKEKYSGIAKAGRTVIFKRR